MAPPTDPEILKLRQTIDACIDDLSEKHRMHRKVRFLLDIRGLLRINKLEGDYVEFGVFRAEMMYAASRVLGDLIGTYIGLDTFAGLPKPQGSDQEMFVFEKEGFMASPLDQAHALIADSRHELIQGDFREAAVREKFHATAGPVAVASIDCNWPSSVESALEMLEKHFQPGTILFMDDWYVSIKTRNFSRDLFDAIERKGVWTFDLFANYAPCARAFILQKT